MPSHKVVFTYEAILSECGSDAEAIEAAEARFEKDFAATTPDGLGMLFDTRVRQLPMQK